MHECASQLCVTVMIWRKVTSEVSDDWCVTLLCWTSGSLHVHVRACPCAEMPVCLCCDSKREEAKAEASVVPLRECLEGPHFPPLGSTPKGQSPSVQLRTRGSWGEGAFRSKLKE